MGMSARRKRMFRVLADIVRAGGKVIEDAEHVEARKRVCAGCKYFGEVRPLPTLVAMGCTICTCPIEEKARTLTVLDRKTLKYVKEYCPHPEGNMWASIDHNFQKSKT